MVYHDFVHVVVSTCCVIFYLVVFLELSWTSSSISRWKVIPTSAHCPPVAICLPWLLEEEGTYFDANLNSVRYVWWRIPRKVHVYMFNACFIVFQSVSILIFQGYDRGWVNREYCTYIVGIYVVQHLLFHNRLTLQGWEDQRTLVGGAFSYPQLQCHSSDTFLGSWHQCLQWRPWDEHPNSQGRDWSRHWGKGVRDFGIGLVVFGVLVVSTGLFFFQVDRFRT